jgi:hypothetical protein
VVIDSVALNSNSGQNDGQVDTISANNTTVGGTVLTNTSPTKQQGKLRIIFWNSNGWEQERCDKISEVALEEESDVICN